MRVVFFGSDDFAAVHLIQLLMSQHDVMACVTQPDRARGRGMKVSESMIKEFAMQHEIETLQPEDVNDPEFIETLEEFEADIFVVVAYGQLLSKDVLDLPRLFCLNVHGSLLPKYRGAAPISWAILNGEEYTGITLIKMNEKMDAGDIVKQEELDIEPDMNSMELRAELAKLGAYTLEIALDAIQMEDYSLEKQNEDEVTYAPKLTKNLGRIKWTQPARHIYNHIRGLQPWPGTFTQFNGKQLKILEANVCDLQSDDHVAGEVVVVTKQGFVVATADQGLHITRVHLESSKPMDAKSFVSGQRLEAGQKLG